MSNTRPNRSKESCDEILKYYDYLRKSYCTQLHGTGEGLFSDKNHTYKKKECEQTLDNLARVTKECMESHSTIQMKK